MKRVWLFIVLVSMCCLMVNRVKAEVVLSSHYLRGIDVQEYVDAVGDAGISPCEESGYLSLWAAGREDMMAVIYKLSGVDRASQSVRITISYSGEGLLGIKNFQESSDERLWTDKYLLPKKDRGSETIYASSSAHTDPWGRMEIYVSVSNSQFLTVESLEVQALDTESPVRVVTEYRYLPDYYPFTVVHWYFSWGPIFAWEAPCRYVVYRDWWESPYYRVWYNDYYYRVIIHHPIHHCHYRVYAGPVVVVRDRPTEPPRRIIRREAPEKKVHPAVTDRNRGELRNREVGRQSVQGETVGEFKIRRPSAGFSSEKRSESLNQRVERRPEALRDSSQRVERAESYRKPTYSVPSRGVNRSSSQPEVKRHLSTPQEVRNRSQEPRTEVRHKVRAVSSPSSIPTKTRQEGIRSTPAPQSRPAPSVSVSSSKKNNGGEQKRRAEANRSTSSGASKGNRRQR